MMHPDEKIKRLLKYSPLLSRREIHCLAHLLDDCTYTEVGALLGLSPRTVELYVKNIRHKLHVATKNELLDLLNREMGDGEQPY